MTWDQHIARYEARKEAFVPVAYWDGKADHSSGNYAIAWGHNGPEVKPGMRVTIDEGRALFRKDLDDKAAIVSRWLKVPVSQHVFNMIHSASFNAGTKLSAVCYFINNGQLAEACDLLRKFYWIDGKMSPGHKTRREQEAAIGETLDPLDLSAYGDLSAFRKYDSAPIPGVSNFKMTPFPEGFP